VLLGAHLYDGAGALLTFDFHAEPLTDPPRTIAPGETVRCRVTLPLLERGRIGSNSIVSPPTSPGSRSTGRDR
jgi:hypothetical protein